MNILLWIDGGMASLGAILILVGLFGKRGSYSADDRMAEAFFTVVGGGLLGVSFILFILLTAIKTWS